MNYIIMKGRRHDGSQETHQQSIRACRTHLLELVKVSTRVVLTDEMGWERRSTLTRKPLRMLGK